MSELNISHLPVSVSKRLLQCSWSYNLKSSYKNFLMINIWPKIEKKYWWHRSCHMTTAYATSDVRFFKITYNHWCIHPQYMMTSSNGNIFCVTRLCAGNSPIPMNSPHKGQWRGALMFFFIWAWINDWVNSHEADDLWHHRGHYDANVMIFQPEVKIDQTYARCNPWCKQSSSLLGPGVPERRVWTNSFGGFDGICKRKQHCGLQGFKNVPEVWWWVEEMESNELLWYSVDVTKNARSSRWKFLL